MKGNGVPSTSTRALLDAAARQPDFADLTPAQARLAFAKAMERCSGAPTPVRAVDEIAIPCRSGARAARVYQPLDDAEVPRAALLWLHGGGFVFGVLGSYDPLCRALAHASKLNLVAFDYRLAPEAPYPAAVQDCEDAWRWLCAIAAGWSCLRHPGYWDSWFAVWRSPSPSSGSRWPGTGCRAGRTRHSCRSCPVSG